MSDGGDVALACASLLVDELERGGVEHACLTPGSRSTALALAVSRQPRLRVHVHVDERSSAFFALGVAKATGRPAVALCSSGTAAANHLPAVVEAFMARAPLIVLTADRPPELRDTGANQTIDQLHLYGRYVRWFFDTGVPALHDGTARYWRSLGARAVAASTAWPPGPVHLNVPFREPLMPSGAAVELGADAAGRADGAPWERVAHVVRTPDPKAIDALRTLTAASERIVIVAGTLRTVPESVYALCAARGWPLLAEPASGLRRGDRALSAGQLLVADDEFRNEHRADVVLQLGAAPVTRAMEAFVQGAKTLVAIDPDALQPDPSRQVALTIPCDPEAVAAALLDGVEPSHLDSAWSGSWRDADAAARRAVDALIDSWDEPFEGRIARDVAAAAPGGILVAGSSMPVRDLDTFMTPRDGLRVLANRGASGIDGTVSTALGVGEAGQPVTALLGDLALLHDASGLVWGGRRSHGLVIVVVDNDGGGIFSLLPQARLDPVEFEALFATPHGGGIDFAALASAAGAGYRTVARAAELCPALRRAAAADGVQLVHVFVDRSRAVEQRAEVAHCVRAALQRGG